MNASRAKELVKDKAMDRKNAHQAKLNRYVEKLTETKIKRAANKGYYGISVKIPKKYFRLEVCDRLQSMGYQTGLMKDMKIMIKW